MKKIYLFPLIFIFSINIFTQDFQHKIQISIENRDYSGAINELHNLEKADQKLFILNNYDYLLARLSEKRGDLALAMVKFQSVLKRNSVLSEYALWHLSQIARSSGNLNLERTYLRQLIALAPESLLKNAANKRLVYSLFESKDYNAVFEILTQPNAAQNPDNSSSINKKGNDSQNRESLVLLGKSYLQIGKTLEAKEVFTKLVSNLPNIAQPDDYALEGAKGLDELEVGKDNFGKIAPEISDIEHFRRASIYQFNRNFTLARLHYLAIVEKFSGSIHTPDSIYQIGRGYSLELRFNEAVKWFERVQSEFPDNSIAESALSQAASSYSRINKPKEAISRYQKFIEKYPQSDTLERAFLNIVDIERDLGEAADALKWTQKTRDNFKGELPEAIALFAQIRIKISESNWISALQDLTELQKFNDLGGTRVPAATNKNEVAFLRAFTLEQLGRFEEATDIYLSIPDGRAEYYGWRATERLKLLALDEKSSPIISQKFTTNFNIAQQNITPQNADLIRISAQNSFRLSSDTNIQQKLLEIVKKTYNLLPAYQKIPNIKLQEFGRKELLKQQAENNVVTNKVLADELLFLGLYDEGTPELETSLREKLTKNSNSLSDFPPETAYTLAVFYKRGDIANRAVGYIEPLWRNIPGDFQIELIPREQAELLYPAPYADSLIKYAPERNVDPRFALSIMRQESRYRADVKSVAAARGLMQFISDTSNKIAVELGKQNFKQDDLYNPPTAILFGSQYLGNLFRLFPNQPQAVAASYNGGEHNMTRWLARAKNDSPDRYVPEIIFSQSKDYVYKVMANYRVYQLFYDENLKPR